MNVNKHLSLVALPFMFYDATKMGLGLKACFTLEKARFYWRPPLLFCPSERVRTRAERNAANAQ